MIKRRTKTIAAIAICIAIGGSTTAYASTNVNRNRGQKNSTAIEMNLKNHGGKWKHNTEILKRLGISEEEEEKAEKSGKTLFQIAKEKGHNESEVRTIVIEEKNKAIDEAVSSGKLTKEKGETIKAKIKERVESWDGSFNHEHKEKHCVQLKAK